MNFLTETDVWISKLLFKCLLLSMFIIPFKNFTIVRFFLMAEIICLLLNSINIIIKFIAYKIAK